MAVQPFKIIKDGYRGDVPINFYPAADSERKEIVHGTPGLLSLCQLTDCTEVRGLYAYKNYLYAVARRGSQSIFWRIDPTGAPSELGTITTSFTGPVWITNNLSQILIVDGVVGGSGYVYTPATGLFTQITDLNFFGAAACDYQDSFGLFIQPNSIYWFLSALQDFTTFDGSRYSKEGTTDNIRGILSNQLEVILGGYEATEIWQDTGGDNTSPATATFQRVPGGLIKYGWGSPKAGCIFDNTAAWLTDKGQVVRLSGYSPNIISTDMMGRAINGDGDTPGFSTYADAFTFSQVDREHTFFWLTFPTGDQTWVYDAKTKLFHKRSSYRDDGSGWGRHRANCYALLNGEHYVGDFSNGQVYKMSSAYYDDDGQAFPSILTFQEQDGGQTRIFYPTIQLLMDMGVGLESGLDPQVMLEKSNDGGKTWNSYGSRSMGKIGEYTRRAYWTRQGSDYLRMYRIVVTDPVKRTVLGFDAGGQ